MKQTIITICFLLLATQTMAAFFTLGDVTGEHAAMDDAGMSGSSPTTKYGEVNITYLSPSRNTLVQFDDIADSLPDTDDCDSAMIGWAPDGEFGSGDITSISITYCKRNWVEADVTWNKYDATNDWTTAGATHADDIGGTPQTEIRWGTGSWVTSFNATDFTVGDTIWFKLDPQWINDIEDVVIANNGFLMVFTRDNNYYLTMRTTEHGVAGKSPMIRVFHSTAPAGGGGIKAVKLGRVNLGKAKVQ